MINMKKLNDLLLNLVYGLAEGLHKLSLVILLMRGGKNNE
jgi:hypothetical protein